MADIGIYTKNADILARCGANCSATAKATAATDVYVLDVEAYINAITRYNWSDAFAGLNAAVAGILTEAGACLCGIYVIQWDMSGFTTTAEAENMINILRERSRIAIEALRDLKIQDFITGA